MAEWLNTVLTGPAFWIASLGGVLSVGMWVGRVNSDRRILKAFMQEIRDDIRRLDAKFDGRFERLEAKFDDRLGRLEQGQARLEGRLEGLEGRLKGLEGRLEGLERRFDGLQDTLAGRAAG